MYPTRRLAGCFTTTDSVPNTLALDPFRAYSGPFPFLSALQVPQSLSQAITHGSNFYYLGSYYFFSNYPNTLYSNSTMRAIALRPAGRSTCTYRARYMYLYLGTHVAMATGIPYTSRDMRRVDRGNYRCGVVSPPDVHHGGQGHGSRQQPPHTGPRTPGPRCQGRPAHSAVILWGNLSCRVRS